MIKNLQFHWIKNSSTVANRHYIRSNIVKATIIITFNFIGSGTKIMFSRFERDPNRTLLFHTAKERRDNSNLQFRWIRNSKIIYIYIYSNTNKISSPSYGRWNNIKVTREDLANFLGSYGPRSYLLANQCLACLLSNTFS